MDRFIVCHGLPYYKNELRSVVLRNAYKDPLCEFTLMIDHIIHLRKIDDEQFKTWLICSDVPEGDIRGIFVIETPEQIRQMIKDATSCFWCKLKNRN
ncbi:MAG: hypothetical protein JSW11_00480 [Candidatus Heimdallarchaeota archaeon]|nr:MAG: hypothetical protein JSW11_00480 [Candidatus Heimdallarchaeota archaeon]